MNPILKDLHPEKPEVYSDTPYDPPRTAEDNLAAQKGDAEQNFMNEAMNDPGKLQSAGKTNETPQKQEVPQPAAPQQTTNQPKSYLDRINQKYQELGGNFKPIDHADEERRLVRQKKIANLTNALLTLGQAYFGTKGYNIPQYNNPVLTKTQQELKRLHDEMDQEAINARRINLSTRQRAVQMVANDDRENAAEYWREKNHELQKKNLDIAKENADANAVYKGGLAASVQQNAKSLADYRKKMVANADKRVKALRDYNDKRASIEDYKARHPKPAKPYMTVTDGSEKKNFSKEEVRSIAEGYLSDVRKDQGNPDIPGFIFDYISSGKPVSDSFAKTVVRWMYEQNQQTDPYGNPIKKKPSLLPK